VSSYNGSGTLVREDGVLVEGNVYIEHGKDRGGLGYWHGIFVPNEDAHQLFNEVGKKLKLIVPGGGAGEALISNWDGYRITIMGSGPSPV